MMQAPGPALKGFITGSLIIILSGTVYYFAGNFDNPVTLAAYFIYALGIVWTLYGFYQSEAETKSFKEYFSQGFRCFIVVTLLLVCANWLFLKFNDGFRQEMVEFQRKQLLLNKNYTPADISNQLTSYEKFILPSYTMSVILSYLGVGSLITLLGSVFFNFIKKDK
jgi:hypothetical protein